MAKLEDVGVIEDGAVILFAEDRQAILSYIPGCYWIGIDSMPEDYTITWLPNTKIRPASNSERISAQARNATWHAARTGKPAQWRILTVLDAFGGKFHGTRAELGEIVNFSRESLTRVLAEITELGYTQKSRGTATLRPEFRGKFWAYKKGDQSRPSEVRR